MVVRYKIPMKSITEAAGLRNGRYSLIKHNSFKLVHPEKVGLPSEEGHKKGAVADHGKTIEIIDPPEFAGKEGDHHTTVLKVLHNGGQHANVVIKRFLDEAAVSKRLDLIAKLGKKLKVVGVKTVDHVVDGNIVMHQHQIGKKLSRVQIIEILGSAGIKPKEFSGHFRNTANGVVRLPF